MNLRLTDRTRVGIIPLDPPAQGTWWFSVFARMLAIVVAGYMLLDRAFAYIHVPFTTLYIGECLVIVAALAMVTETGWTRSTIARNGLLVLLLAFMGWGALRTLPNLGRYRLDALRDAALWYYAVLAIALASACTALPRLPEHLASRFRRLAPVLILWLPIVIVSGKIGALHVRLPGTPVAISSFKGGNAAVLIAFAFGGLWLLPDSPFSRRKRAFFSLAALLGVLVAATQTRGGGGSALLAMLTALCFVAPRRRFRLFLSGFLVIGLLATVAWSTNFTVRTNKRVISFEQVIENAQSVTGDSSAGNLEKTVDWRKTLWSNVLHREIASGRLIDGYGFGPNLAIIGGLTTTTNATAGRSSLRSVHNSHFDMLARMGVIGLALWILLWVGWFVRLLMARSRFKRAGDAWSRGIAELCLVGAVGLLPNAFFDPTFESPQVAAVLWTVFGLGAAMSVRRAARQAPDDHHDEIAVA